jgi:hypothetical protein
MFSPMLFAQVNLVPNPSFMLNDTVPTPLGLNKLGMHWITRLNNTIKFPLTVFNDPNHVHNWFRANQGTVDYYHSKAHSPEGGLNDSAGVKVPQNWGQGADLWGNGGTLDSAYAGIDIIRFKYDTTGASDYHEYLAVKLGQHLKNNKEYLVQFKYAMAEYAGTGPKNARNISGRERNKYYLKNFGVAFAPNSDFIDYDSTKNWQSPGAHSVRLPLSLAYWNYVNIRELAHADSGIWQTFQTRFICDDSTLQYIIIGNFDQRISLDDIGKTNYYDQTDDPTNDISYEFYTFIDSVVVKEIETNSCNCTSISLKTSKRDSTLEVSNPGHCCYVSTIKPTAFSCKFWGVRVSISGVPISTPAIKNFGHPVTDTEQVQVSFCIEKNESELSTLVTFEFLDADSNVICTKAEFVYCNCECTLLQSQWGYISVLREQVANDSGRCCWEYSIVNKGSCDFLPTTASLNVDCKDSTGFNERGTYSSIAPWVKSDSLGIRKFSSSLGFPHSYGTSPSITKVFKVCIDPQVAGTKPPKLTIGFAADSNYYQVAYCRRYEDYLSCIASENCCDKLNIELKRYSQTSYDCAFDVIISNKGALSKCKVFGVRIKSGSGDTLYTLNPQSQPLNLDKPKQIWHKNVGNCGIVVETGQPTFSDVGYTIEILDSLGAVKCSVKDTVHCCYKIPDANKSTLHDEPSPTLLAVGGMIAEATIEGGSLHYLIKNNGDALFGTLRLTSLKGDVVLQQNRTLPKGNSLGELPITQLSSGTYYFSIQTDLWQTAQQIVIVR